MKFTLLKNNNTYIYMSTYHYITDDRDDLKKIAVSHFH